MLAGDVLPEGRTNLVALDGRQCPSHMLPSLALSVNTYTLAGLKVHLREEEWLAMWFCGSVGGGACRRGAARGVFRGVGGGSTTYDFAHTAGTCWWNGGGVVLTVLGVSRGVSTGCRRYVEGEGGGAMLRCGGSLRERCCFTNCGSRLHYPNSN